MSCGAHGLHATARIVISKQRWKRCRPNNAMNQLRAELSERNEENAMGEGNGRLGNERRDLAPNGTFRKGQKRSRLSYIMQSTASLHTLCMSSPRFKFHNCEHICISIPTVSVISPERHQPSALPLIIEGKRNDLLKRAKCRLVTPV